MIVEIKGIAAGIQIVEQYTDNEWMVRQLDTSCVCFLAGLNISHVDIKEKS